MKLVIVNGCFDICHAAHIHLLETARALGDRLIVLVNSDASIERLKGRPPANCLRDRIAVLKALRCVDGAIAFDTENDLQDLLMRLQPAFVVRGADHRGGARIGAHGGHFVYVPSLTEQRSSKIRDDNRLLLEMATFEAMRAGLLRDHPGEFALLCGARLIGTFPSYEDAIEAGYQACGLRTSFAVQEITAVDRVHSA